MQLNDPVSSFPPPGVRADQFDLLDMTGSLLVEALRTAARRRLRPCDVPGLLDEIAALLESRLDGGGDDIWMHYLAAKLREDAKNDLD